MSTAAPDVPLDEPAERPRLLAVEIGDWPGLEQPVRLELDARQTVLVGKNGAGKSLLVEGLYWASLETTGFWKSTMGDGPHFFRCEVERPASTPVGYWYRIDESDRAQEAEPPDAANDRSAENPPWAERGFRLADGGELWSVSRRVLTISGRHGERIARGTLSPYYIASDHPEIEAEVLQLTEILEGCRLIRPGTLRRDDASNHHLRRKVLLQRTEDRWRRGRSGWVAIDDSEVDNLGESIITLWDKNRPLYDELVEILCGLGLVRDVAIDVYKGPHSGRVTTTSEDVAAVLLDGTNLGLCSDGTWRVAQIVLDLIRPGISCLLIEEPETAVHPGLLDKLLALIEAYSADRQVVLSTHSPQVVDRFAPHQLRLVERESGVTRVHSLSAADRALAVSYLRDQGSLADFVFRRSDA